MRSSLPFGALARGLLRLLRPRVPFGGGGSRGGTGRGRSFPPWRGEGGAGVREPRRPRPTNPAAAATAEPEPDQFLDIGSGH
ncbi:MAG TPA: hypothetical protein VFI30_08060 [Nocardioidaceae bacterium]|nr:hypothetical protein [Nocardioidaceae bacterium]